MDPQDAAVGRLTSAQRAAWRHVIDVVRNRQADARTRAKRILRNAGCTPLMLDTAMDCVRRHARVVLHFHPDRIGVKPMTVAEALLEDGQYCSQFETGLSSGGLTAYPGGPRDEWERALFGGAYHRHESTIGERPKYGALELIRYPVGTSEQVFRTCVTSLTLWATLFGLRRVSTSWFMKCSMSTLAGAPTPRPISVGRTRLAFAAAASRQTIEYLEQRLYPTTTAALALERETPAVRRTLNA